MANINVTSGEMVKFDSGWTLSRFGRVCQKCCVAFSHTSCNSQIQGFPVMCAGWLYQPLYPLPGIPVIKHQPWRSGWKRPPVTLTEQPWVWWPPYFSGDYARPWGKQWAMSSRARSHTRFTGFCTVFLQRAPVVWWLGARALTRG